MVEEVLAVVLVVEVEEALNQQIQKPVQFKKRQPVQLSLTRFVF